MHSDEFFDFMKHCNKFNEVTLVFGQDDFCQYNLRGALWMLQQIKYTGKINILYIDENTYASLKEVKDIDLNKEIHNLDKILK